MKRINYGPVSYLVGDDIADLLVLYTARLAASQLAEAVEVTVLGPAGNTEVASFALGPGITMTAESTRSDLDEPDNAEVAARIREAIGQLTPTQVLPMSVEDVLSMDNAFDSSI